MYNNYNFSIDDLFNGGGKQGLGTANLTNFSIIIDNTNLIWKIQNDYSFQQEIYSQQNNAGHFLTDIQNKLKLLESFESSHQVELEQIMNNEQLLEQEVYQQLDKFLDKKLSHELKKSTQDDYLQYYFGSYLTNSQKPRVSRQLFTPASFSFFQSLQDDPTPVNPPSPFSPPDMQNITLTSTVKVVYNVSEKYFIMTVVFASLTVIVIGILITVVVLYKRKRKEYREFLKHKDKKMKGDTKKFEYQIEDMNNNNNHHHKGGIDSAQKEKVQWLGQQQQPLLDESQSDSDRPKVVMTGSTKQKIIKNDLAQTQKNKDQDEMSFQKTDYLNTSNNNHTGYQYSNFVADDQDYQPKQYMRRLPQQNQYKLIGSNNQRTISDFGVTLGNNGGNGITNMNYGYNAGLAQNNMQGGGAANVSYQMKDNRFTDDLTKKKNNNNGIYYIDSSDSD